MMRTLICVRTDITCNAFHLLLMCSLSDIFTVAKVTKETPHVI